MMLMMLMVGEILVRCGAAWADDKVEATVLREGEGTRRIALDRLERKPFPADALAKLSDWKNGPAMTTTSLQGKVTLFVTWTDYLPSAKRAVALAKRMSEQHKADASVVLVHSVQDWDKALKPMNAEGAALLIAHDAKGEFRGALQVDQDPDYYVVDRAGQLRFADITEDAVEGAIALLAAETIEGAAGVNARLADVAKAEDTEFRKGTGLNGTATLVDIPTLPFSEPSEAEYEAAKWPLRPLDESVQDDPKAQKAANKVALPETGWLPKQPDMKGKATLVYIWNPKVPGSYHDVMPVIDRYQRQNRRDLVVVGLLEKSDSITTGSGQTPMTKDDKDPEKLKKRMESIFSSRNTEHFMVYSEAGNTYQSAAGSQNSNAFPIPAFLLLSSDGKCRWWTDEKSRVTLDAAVLQVIRNDPGIKARREAEEKWLAGQKK